MNPVRSSIKPYLAHLPPLLFLAGYCLWLFWPIPFAKHTMDSWEVFLQFYPWTDYWVQHWWAGSYPLWDPYSFGGSPFLGNIQVAIYYPTMFLLPLISPILSFGWTFLLHTFLSGAMMYLLIFHLTRNRVAAVVIGLAFCSGGAVILRTIEGHITILNGLPWLPAAIWAFLRWMDKKNFFRWTILVLIITLQILAGQPQIPFLTLFLLGLLALGRTGHLLRKKEKDWIRILLPLGGLFIATIAAALLSAVFWFPFYELNQVSAIRSQGASFEWATKDSLPPSLIFSFFLPFLFGDQSQGNFWGTTIGYWEVCGFVGLGTFIFFLFSLFLNKIPWKKTWIFSFILLLLLALGSHTFIYSLFYQFFPVINRMRVPARFIIPASVCLCVLAGYGLDRILRENLRPYKKDLLWLSALTVGLLLFALLILTFFPGHIANHPLVLSWVTQSSAQHEIRSLSEAIQIAHSRTLDCRQSLFIGLCFLLPYMAWCWLKFFQPSWKKLSAGILLVIAAFEMGWFAHRFIATAPAGELLAKRYPKTDSLTFVQNHTGLERVILPDLMIGWKYREVYPEVRPNRLMIYELQPVRGCDTSYMKSYAEYVYGMQGLPVPNFLGAFMNITEPRFFRRPLLSALNARYYITPEPLSPAPSDFKLVYNGKPLVYEYQNAFPRAYILPEDLAIPKTLPEDATVEITQYTPNEVRMKAELSHIGWLVFAENYYYEWKAEVNGRPMEIEKVLNTFRGLLLEPGRHEVRMYYDPIGCKKGLALSLTTLIGLGVLILIRLKRERTQFPP